MSKSVRMRLGLAVGVGLGIGFVLATAGAQAQSLELLGRAATPAEIAAWDIDIRPDGQGLPEGAGDVWTGETLYVEQCAACHGDFGEAIGRWPVLAGGHGSLTNDRPVKTVGSYWPYLSTVFDYVHRAMPFGHAQSLSDDEVYAVTAYILYLNDLVDEDFVLDRDILSGFEMPNAAAFHPDDRADVEHTLFTGDPCMHDCRETVEITARAAVIDVTPEDEAARKARAGRAAGSDPAPAETGASGAVDGGSGAIGIAATTPPPDTATGDDPASDPPPEGAASPPADTGTGQDARPDPDMIAEGEQVFRQCLACHKVGEDARSGVGPMLNGIVGHRAGAVEGYRYSDALKDAAAGGLVWTPEALQAFLADPRAYLPGTKMAFRGLQSDEDIAAVNAYLGSFEK